MNPTVFIEAFLARLLPVYQEVTLNAIRHLQPELYVPHLVVASIGGIAACALWYAVGIWLRRMPERVSTPEQRERIEVMRGHAHFWLPYLLVLSPTPIGGVVVMAAGFFRVRPMLAWPVILLSEIVFRAMPFLTKIS